MREIKFKAWDKEKKIMWTDEKPTGQGTYWHIESNGYVDLTENNICRDSEDFILMQFTGLKDKNGKEIYEGDIVKKDNKVFVVKYIDSDASFWLIIPKMKLKPMELIRPLAELDIRFDEVIGNIYENPELLKQTLINEKGAE